MSEKANQKLNNQRASIERGGGLEAIEAQHAKGKMTARERINYLLDEGTFQEIDAFAKHHCTNFGLSEREIPCDGVITGYGKIGGRVVGIYSQDFTVMGGSLGKQHALKISKILDFAYDNGFPCIGINDSGGARIQEGVDALSGFGNIFFRNVRNSGVVPQITAIMGPCAGGAVYSPALTDFIFMTRKTSNMFITGPQVIKTVTGEDVSAENLGGADVHMQNSGVCHFAYDTEKETLDGIRRLLSFLPQNSRENPPTFAGCEKFQFDKELDTIIPSAIKHGYDVRTIIKRIVDDGDFFEVQESFAKNVVVGFSRINGNSVGIIANQACCLAGCLEINASDKAARFIRFCDAFNIPLLTLVDVPGFLPGVAQEKGGIIRHGAKILYAYSESTVPKVTLILRKAYGGAYIGMSSKELGADIVYSWPEAEIAVMGSDGAANIIFRKEIEKSENPESTRIEKTALYRNEFANPYKAASNGYVDDIIDPGTSRQKIAYAFEMLKNKSDIRIDRKHGNIPL